MATSGWICKPGPLKTRTALRLFGLDYKVKQWNQWQYEGSRQYGITSGNDPSKAYFINKTIHGVSPDIKGATLLGKSVVNNRLHDAVDPDRSAYDRDHLKIADLERAPPDAGNGGGGGGGNAGGSGGNDGGSGGNSSSPGNQTVTADRASITMSGSSTTTLSGNDDSVTATGSGGTVNFAGQRESAAIGSGWVNLWAGASGTVTGDGNTVSTYDNTKVTAKGNRNTLILNGTGGTAAVTGDNATATVYGAGKSISFAGSGETLHVAAAGTIVTADQARIDLWNNAAAAVTGAGNNITLNANGTVRVSGAPQSRHAQCRRQCGDDEQRRGRCPDRRRQHRRGGRRYDPGLRRRGRDGLRPLGPICR